MPAEPDAARLAVRLYIAANNLTDGKIFVDGRGVLGQYRSAREVVRAALRLFEDDECTR